MQLRTQHYNKHDLGYADFFPARHKHKMLRLAGIKPTDVLYDMGCGDASMLVFAAEEFGVRKAIGFENDPRRNFIARKRVESEGYSNRIHIYGDMSEADLTKADVIFHMLPEYEEDFEVYKHGNVRRGTRFIKHDLPLLGVRFDEFDYPFYKMTFPLKTATSIDDWAQRVLQKEGATIEDLWHELYYYQYEKSYTKWDIKRFQRILSKRFDH